MSSTPELKEKSFVPQQGKKKPLDNMDGKNQGRDLGDKSVRQRSNRVRGREVKAKIRKMTEKSLVQMWDRGRGKVKQYLVSEEHKNWLISVFYSPSCQPAIHAVCISLFSWDVVKIVHLHEAFPAREPQPEELFSTAIKKAKRGKRIKKYGDTSSTVPQTALWWQC